MSFWENFWMFLQPSLLLCAGILLGVIFLLLIPISDEERRKVAKEIEEGLSNFADEFFCPLKGLGSLAWRFAFFCVIGMFSITVIGSMLSDVLNLSEIYDITIRIVTLAAEYLPPIVFIPIMAYVGQETWKLFDLLFKWGSKLVLGAKKMFNLIEKEEADK